MAENNQLSDEAKINSTNTSSTDDSSAVIGNHENAVVPHKISNHDKLVQTMVMVDGEWINVNDTNDQANMKEDVHKVNKKVVEAQKGIVEAKNAADSAVKYADSAVSASKVNSDAIAAQSSAISEAKIALDSATAEIQQTASNAASDAAQIRADVAQIQKEVDTAQFANSASVEKLKSDIGSTQKNLDAVRDDLTQAQSAVEQNRKLINDSVAKINSDIAQNRQDIATVQQANGDFAKQLDTYSKEAQEQGKTIKSIQDKQDGFSATIADVKGNVSKVSDTVDGLTAGLKDAQGNIASVKTQADQLNTTLTDHSKNITQLTATAEKLSSTLEDANGRLSKVEQTAAEQSTTLSDLQGNLTQVKQTTDGLVTTLKDAQGNIDQIKQDAKGTLEQLSNAQGDITTLQTDVSGIKTTIADHDKNIHTLQADSETLKDDMADAKGNISGLQKTATSLTSEMQDHAGRISRVEQTASTLTNEFSDQQGHLNRVEQTANGTKQTVANQQGQINSIQTDVSGVHQTITGQGNQIANINVTLSGLNSKYEGVSGDLNNLKSQAQWATVTSAVDLNNIKTPCREFLKGAVTNAPNETAWWYLTVEGSEGDRITQTVIADRSNNRYTRRFADSWSAWVRDATQTDITALSGQITTNSTQIDQNKQAIALKADQTTVNNLSGEVNQNKAQLEVQAGQISSKVSSEDFKTLNDKVNGMKIGGRNLVVGTGQDTIIDDTANAGTQGWLFTIIHLTQQPKVGDKITVSAESTLTGKGHLDDYTVLLYNDTITNPRSSQDRLKSGRRSSATITVDNLNGSGDTVLLIYAGNPSDTQGKKNVIHHLKVEFGNVATDWTPAPEDLTTAIQKNSTAIDQTNKQISLKADQTEVDQVKQTATQNSSRLDVMANEIQSKVTSTDVDNIINGKGYATTSTVQSLITQNAGTINENITQLDTTFKTGMENSVQLVRKSDFEDGSKGGWTAQAVVSATNPAPPAELGPSGMKVLQTNVRDAYEDGIWYSVKPDEKFDVDYWCAPSSAFHTTFGLVFTDKDKVNWNWLGINSDQSGQWKHYTGTITAPANAAFARPWFQMEKPADNTADTSWIAKPSIRRQNASTVSAIQNIQVSVDGLKSAVASKADESQVTQLSNLVQSKVSSSDFNSKITQLANDINLRVTKGDLLSQINIAADNTLIQSGKIYFDADSFVMSPNSKAFIPSAYITNINADKITTGTLDAAKFNVKNFSADNIVGGTLSGVVVKTGDNDRYFQTSKDNIYWVRKGSMSLVGNDTYLNSANGLNIADMNNIQLTTWGGATVNKDGSITNNSGNSGHPKIVIDDEGKYNPDDIYGSAFGGGPGDNEIVQWVGDKEYTALARNQGFTVHLNDGNNKSIFAIQKDNKVGFYVGQGENGNQVNVQLVGDGSGFNVHGNFNVYGAKNSAVKTSQGDVAVSAYETAEYYFGDIGEGQTDSNGVAYVGIEKLFNETVNTSIPYQVFITAYGPGNVWVEQRKQDRFMVKSSQPNIKFGWEIKAKRRGYENTRLQKVN